MLVNLDPLGAVVIGIHAAGAEYANAGVRFTQEKLRWIYETVYGDKLIRIVSKRQIEGEWPRGLAKIHFGKQRKYWGEHEFGKPHGWGIYGILEKNFD